MPRPKKETSRSATIEQIEHELWHTAGLELGKRPPEPWSSDSIPWPGCSEQLAKVFSLKRFRNAYALARFRAAPLSKQILEAAHTTREETREHLRALQSALERLLDDPDGFEILMAVADREKTGPIPELLRGDQAADDSHSQAEVNVVGSAIQTLVASPLGRGWLMSERLDSLLALRTASPPGRPRHPRVWAIETMANLLWHGVRARRQDRLTNRKIALILALLQVPMGDRDLREWTRVIRDSLTRSE